MTRLRGPAAARGAIEPQATSVSRPRAVRRPMDVVCPKCDAHIHKPETFEDHMARAHPGTPAPLGFGHTLEQ